MTRIYCFYFFFIFSCSVLAQTNFNDKLDKTMMGKLNNGDSLTYYQCRATEASVEIKTDNQQLQSKKQPVSITEKFVIVHRNDTYVIRYSVSGLTMLPNKKFSGLKMREKDYWNFTFKKERQLDNMEVLFLAGLQKIGRETTEYDFTVSKYTSNQMIIHQRKNFEQLLLKENLSISEALKL